jgi:hypothetical protein
MKKDNNSFMIDGFQAEEQCRENSYYVRFTEEDIEQLAKYAFDLGYSLEPEIMNSDPEHPLKFKIICKANSELYGWIAKVIEYKEDQWQEAFLYGFYKHGSFRIKYPITFNVNSKQMRGIMKRNAVKNKYQTTYFRTIFGILDLEPQISAVNFIFSWLSSCKFKHS